MTSEYDFEMGRVMDEIKQSNAKRVGLQFPEGLKQYAVEIAHEIEDKTEATVAVFTDPVYGACDLKEDQAKKLGLDLIIHYGHTEYKE